VQGWWDLQDAAIEAISWPGTVVPVYGGKVRYAVSRGFLWCSLPSGRVLAYKRPHIVQERTHNKIYYMSDGTPVHADEVFATDLLYHEDGTLVSEREREGKVRNVARYEGLDDTKQWRVLALYGGLQCNHVVQGTARCVIADKMLLVDLMGYDCVLTVHDEIVSEVPEGFGHLQEYEQLVTAPLAYLPGLPLAAKVWKDVRYG
jgi:DNA polymerase